MRAFLLVVGECDLASGGNHIEEVWQTVGLNRMEWPFPNNANAAVPPPAPPRMGGLLDVDLHPRKSVIDPSSLAGFHPGPLVVASPSHHLVATAGCCILS